MHIYGDIYSGNCYKVALLLHQLGKAYRWTHVDILRGESRSPEFLARSVQGKIPVLELDDGRCLAESNAILNYLAEGSDLLPDDPLARAEVLRWQFWEQNQHEGNVASARFVVRYLGDPPERATDLRRMQENGRAALSVMDRHLASNDYLAADRYTIADISLFAYTHVADEGGIALAPFAHVRAWLDRVAAQSGHVSMGELAATLHPG